MEIDYLKTIEYLNDKVNKGKEHESDIIMKFLSKCGDDGSYWGLNKHYKEYKGRVQERRSFE